MARKKINLAFITNKAARKNTFNKRKKNILKKLSELSTLCAISTCAIIFGPDEQQADVWPSPLDAKRMLNMFKKMPELGQRKKMLSHEEFLRQRITKIRDQWRKVHRENRKKEMTTLMFQCLTGKALDDLTMLDITDLNLVVDEKMKAIDKRIEALKKTPSEIGTSRSLTAASSEEDITALNVAVNDLQGQPWFRDGMNMNLNEPMPPFFGNEVVPPCMDHHAWIGPLFP